MSTPLVLSYNFWLRQDVMKTIWSILTVERKQQNHFLLWSLKRSIYYAKEVYVGPRSLVTRNSERNGRSTYVFIFKTLVQTSVLYDLGFRTSREFVVLFLLWPSTSSEGEYKTLQTVGPKRMDWPETCQRSYLQGAPVLSNIYNKRRRKCRRSWHGPCIVHESCINTLFYYNGLVSDLIWFKKSVYTLL